MIKRTLYLVAMMAILSTSAYGQEEEPSRILFTNVNVFDGVDDELAMGMSVLVEGNLISEVATAIPAPPGATIIDGGGRTLMPGMIDSHVHMAINNDFVSHRDFAMQLEDVAIRTVVVAQSLLHGRVHDRTGSRGTGVRSPQGHRQRD